MKILTVAGWMYPDVEGGSFRVVYEVALRHAARGHEVHVLTQRLDERHPEHEELHGIHVHRYDTFAKHGVGFYTSTIRQVRRLVDRLHEEVGFDILTTHHPVSAYAALRAKSTRDLPFLAVLHSLYFLEYVDRHTYDPGTGLERPLPWHRRLVARALKAIDRRNLLRSNRIVVLSEFSRNLVREHCPDCLPKVVTLSGGADLERFRPEPSRADARRKLGLDGVGLPDGPALFFTCRRLEHRMGLVELIEATRRLRDEGRNVALRIAGRGALADALQRRIDDAHLTDAVRLLGYVSEDDLRLHYRAADCFVIPTRALEGFGLVTAEAMACGTPVIGTPVGATPEIIRPFDERLVADDASAEGIARAMGRFLDDVASDATLGRRCRQYAEEHLSWTALADGTLGLFGELLERGGRP
ncbi:glycosyltransferase family 4 protein [bacterium]|nr:glycosyltransferase family 4 protein [bacterium]